MLPPPPSPDSPADAEPPRPPAPPDPRLGTTLSGRYRLLEVISVGGFGTIYLAADEQLNQRLVVVKILLDKAAADEWFQRKFSQEIEALSRLNHPGIVQVYDAGTLPEGTPFLVMQWIEGVTLRQVIRLGGLELERVARIVQLSGQALAAAHAQGIIHRDLKPENIMVRAPGTRDEQITLIDFGIASIHTGLDRSPAKTKVAGTFTYMAPEQFDGQPVAASDVYSLGIIAFEMLAGAPPSQGKPMFELMLMQREGTWPKIATLRPSVPLAAQEVLLRALSFDPAKRGDGIREFADTLSGALLAAPAGEPTIVEPPSPLPEPPPVAENKSKRGWFSGHLGRSLLLSGLVAAAAVLGWALWPLLEPVAAPVPVRATRALSYSIQVQRYRSGQPFGAPFRLAREVVFADEDGIVLDIELSGHGYFYAVDETTDGRVKLLYPQVGDPMLGGATVRLPAMGDIWFDPREHGEERLWIVWSKLPLPDLAALPRQNARAIPPPAEVKHLLTPNGQTSAGAGRTVISTPGTRLVSMIPLTHR
ncbi:MAG: protein kinase [Acidobacteria bacterium]|nr:protein kinase [Acidobacteriota bacterium]